MTRIPNSPHTPFLSQPVPPGDGPHRRRMRPPGLVHTAAEARWHIPLIDSLVQGVLQSRQVELRAEPARAAA